MVTLGVNVDHVATVRQARGIDEPDPVTAAAFAELAGAECITVHLREDRRHIQDRDVEILRQTVKTRLNLEMAATEEMIGIALKLLPDCVTLVPEKREELTTEGGLDVVHLRSTLKEQVATLRQGGMVVSLFVDPDLEQVKAAHRVGAQAIELHTGRYCEARDDASRKAELGALETAMKAGKKLGLQINAGHGLNYVNVREVVALGGIQELNIGHSIVARAVLVGMERAVREMVALLKER